MAHRKLERFAELDTFPNAVYMPYAEAAKDNFPLKGNWNSSFFKNDNRIVLELGCGKGEHTIDLASHDPQSNFIGVDIKGNRLWKGAKTGMDRRMNNVGFLRTRIDFIDKAFSSSEVSEIWITFPDPQKEKDRKRLTHPMFLERYRKIVKPGATIHLKTDSLMLHEYTLDVVSTLGLTVKDKTKDLYKEEGREAVRRVQTFYEKIYLARNIPITYLQFSL